MQPGTPSEGTADNLTVTLAEIRALPAGGVAVLIGAMDRGKTTLAGLAASALAGELGQIAIVDTDIGQSEIGPPGTVGVAWAAADTQRLHDLRPAALFFAGGITPRAVALEWLVAASAAIAWARRAGADRILVDTPGDVTGPAARRLFAALAASIHPDLLLTLTAPEAGPDDAGALAALVAQTCGAHLQVLSASPDVRRKPVARRSLIRRTRLFAALESGAEIRLPILALPAQSGVLESAGPARISTLGASLGNGSTVAPHLTRWIGETLHLPRVDGLAPVLHAEIDAGILTAFVQNDRALPPIDATRSGIVAQHFGVTAVRVLPISGLIGTFVGLIGEGGLLLGIGRFEGLATGSNDAIIFTALRDGAMARLRLLQFGRFRISRDGEFLSDIRPGET